MNQGAQDDRQLSRYQRRSLFVLAVLSLVLLVETAWRVSFPWDLYVWSESPFLVNMLKLENGSPIFTSPADANSFVYSPGLECITWCLLKPMGLQLDVRFIRIVNVMIGLVGAGCAALVMRELMAGSAKQRVGAKTILAAGFASLLVQFKNFTADVSHPDNLVMLHATSVLFFTLVALRRRSLAFAAGAMVWAGAGVLCKQTQALTFIGPALAFAWFNRWDRWRWGMLAGLGVLSASLSLAWLWSAEYARFYTFDLLSHHGVNFKKLLWIAHGFARWDRLFILGLGLAVAFPACWFVWHRLKQKSGEREFFVTWAVIGGFAIAPNLASFLKAMGTWNNLMIFLAWLVLLLWPLFWLWLADPKTRTARRKPVAALALMSLVLLPVKVPPTPQQHRYCAAIQESIQTDLNAGRRVLVSHGAEFLIRAGNRKIPRDLANSILELDAGGKTEHPETLERIRINSYDRIYLVSEQWYGAEVRDSLRTNYSVLGAVPGPAWRGRFVFGHQGLMDDCEILSPPVAKK